MNQEIFMLRNSITIEGTVTALTETLISLDCGFGVRVGRQKSIDPSIVGKKIVIDCRFNHLGGGEGFIEAETIFTEMKESAKDLIMGAANKARSQEKSGYNAAVIAAADAVPEKPGPANIVPNPIAERLIERSTAQKDTKQDGIPRIDPNEIEQFSANPKEGASTLKMSPPKEVLIPSGNASEEITKVGKQKGAGPTMPQLGGLPTGITNSGAAPKAQVSKNATTSSAKSGHGAAKGAAPARPNAGVAAMSKGVSMPDLGQQSAVRNVAADIHQSGNGKKAFAPDPAKAAAPVNRGGGLSLPPVI